MSTTTVTPVCPCCNQMLDTYVQSSPIPKYDGLVYGTCRTAGCDYEDVTLEDVRWSLLATDVDLQADYQGMKARESW